MDDRLKRHIQDTIQHLELNEAEGNYLKSCMQMAYTLGERHQLDIDHESTMKIIGGIGKK